MLCFVKSSICGRLRLQVDNVAAPGGGALTYTLVSTWDASRTYITKVRRLACQVPPGPDIPASMVVNTTRDFLYVMANLPERIFPALRDNQNLELAAQQVRHTIYRNVSISGI